MPPVTEAETQSTLLEAVRALPSESQRAVLSYALFLHHQEEARRADADEATWDRHFSRPEKLARFAQWAKQSLDQHPAEPLDESRL
jgi:hypothetical protein